MLFLCTANSARSQNAEALLVRKAHGRFVVASAGAEPAIRVNPLALQVLREFGIDWSSRTPKRIEALHNERWDFVITVCDRAKEACPTFPGRPVFAHRGMPDPAAVASDDQRLQAFRETLQYLNRRIDLMLAIPFETLERALEERLREVGARLETDASELAR